MGVVCRILVRFVFFHLGLVSNGAVGLGVEPSHSQQHYDCGGKLDGVKGYIESPLFPEAYPPEVDCSWQIQGRPGHQIQLTSLWFNVEDHDQCLWDYVRVVDGPSGRYGDQIHCGTSAVNYLSTSPSVRLDFHTDLSGNDAGFKIRFEQVPPHRKLNCNVTLTQEGGVMSPYHPLPYPSGVTCVTNVVAPANHRIQLEFSAFDVESQPCTFDRLEVYWKGSKEGTYAMGTFCGRTTPTALVSDSNEMTLKFISDDSIQTSGFKASIRFLPPPPTTTTTTTTTTTSTTTSSPATTTRTTTTSSPSSPSSSMSSSSSPTDSRTQDCNTTVSQMVMNVTSPAYPANYPGQQHCVTRFRHDVTSKFVVTFYNFFLEESEECSYDYVSVYQVGVKPSTPPTLLRKLCGDLGDDIIVTGEGRGLDLVFHSDMSINRPGYQANVLVSPLKKTSRCPDVCQNGGSCAETLLPDGSVDWICACTDDFTGVFCEIASPQSCASINCRHGGVCRKDVSGAVCVCPQGYSGRLCEEQVRVQARTAALVFTRMARNLSLSIGSSAILECAVNNASANVMWLFQDRILTRDDWSRGVEVHPGGVVIIHDVRDVHEGRYTCMAVTSDDLVEKSMWLTLKEACSLEVTKAPSNLTVAEGMPALFPCYVPAANVTLWTKDGDLLTQGSRKRVLVNHYLVIDPVQETDSGHYTCLARGVNGCYSKVSAYLTVQTKGHRPECGKARTPPGDNLRIGGRITNGVRAAQGSAPWHVVIRDARADKTFCGGSLISRDTVLTAAHCVTHFDKFFGYPFDSRQIQLFIGTHHCGGHDGIYRRLKWYTLHEQLDTNHFINDIAVFRLNQPVDYSDDVMSICLERPAFVEEIMKPGQLGLVVGCGDRSSFGLTPKFLREVQIPIVERSTCGERAVDVNASFTDGMFCAGYAIAMRGDACTGDSGGAYTLHFQGRAILVGIVSWGVNCDAADHYGYYTYAAHYYDWIMEKLQLE